MGSALPDDAVIDGEVPLQRRTKLETNVFPLLDEPSRPSPVLSGWIPGVINAVKEQGPEGLAAKQRGSRYEQKSDPMSSRLAEVRNEP